MAKTLSGGNLIGQMLVLTIRIIIERKVCYLRVRAFFSQRLTAAISRIVLPTNCHNHYCKHNLQYHHHHYEWGGGSVVGRGRFLSVVREGWRYQIG